MTGNRHSDKEKFCNDLNGPKTPKMSERPLKTLQYFETSKLNTPRPLDQTATISECRYRCLRVSDWNYCCLAVRISGPTPGCRVCQSQKYPLCFNGGIGITTNGKVIEMDGFSPFPSECSGRSGRPSRRTTGSLSRSQTKRIANTMRWASGNGLGATATTNRF